MKNALVFVLLFATLLPTVSQWGTIAYYHANKEYIARVLCENRDKPQLHCDGKCYLAKRLKAQQTRQAKEMAGRIHAMPTLTLFCSDIWTFVLAPWSRSLSQHLVLPYYLAHYRVSLAAIFQPPRF